MPGKASRRFAEYDSPPVAVIVQFGGRSEAACRRSELRFSPGRRRSIPASWQSGEVEKGTALLISHARQRVTADLLDKFFSASLPQRVGSVTANC